MSKSSTRRQSYSGKRRDEEYPEDFQGRENQQSNRNSGGNSAQRQGQGQEEYAQDYQRQGSTNAQSGSCQTDTLIADMARGFVEAQAKLSGVSADSQSGQNPEMLQLLQKISSQLDGLQTPKEQQNKQKPQQGASATSQAGTDQSGGAQGGSQSTNADSNNNNSNSNTQELQALFSKLLQGGASNNQSKQSGQNETQATSGKQSKGSQTVTAQTAAQVLAQAQYELANELETSLKKLKQVIAESEKLADQISNLLGEESNTKQK